MKDEKLGIYHNIESIDMLDDGSMNVALKNGKEAIIEIVKFNNRFTAAIYRWFGPSIEGEQKKNSLFKKLEEHDGYQACARDALGWIDENHVEFVKQEEKKIEK